MYGVSELLDFEPSKTNKLLTTIGSSLPAHSSFLVVDPLSHQFCCEKERHLQSIFLQQSFTCQKEGHTKVSVSRSILEPQILSFCTKLNLQINRDIKLSCHVWYKLFQKTSHATEISVSTETPEKVLILTHLPCVNEWRARLRANCRTNVWQLRDSSDDSNSAMYSRLLANWNQFGGVFCIPYSM